MMTVEVKVNGELIAELELENIGVGTVPSNVFDERVHGAEAATGYKVTARRVHSGEWVSGPATTVLVSHYPRDGAGCLIRTALGRLPHDWWAR